MKSQVEHNWLEKYHNHLSTKNYILNSDIQDYYKNILNIHPTVNDLYYVYDLENEIIVKSNEINQYFNDKLNSYLNILSTDCVSNIRFKNDVLFKIIKFHFADNYITITERHIKLLYKVNDETIGMSYKSVTYIVFQNNVIKKQLSEHKYIDVSLHETIDFVNTTSTLIYDMPNFLIVNDLRKEINGVFINNLTYTDVGMHMTRNDVILNKWKTITKILPYVNINKLYYWELNLFRQLFTKLTEKEFKRVLNWYVKDKQKNRNIVKNQLTKIKWDTFYDLYIYNRIKHTITDDEHYEIIFNDYLNICKLLKLKIQSDFKTFNKLKKKEQDLARTYTYRTIKGGKIQDFNKDEKWNKLFKNIKKYDNITHMKNNKMLHKEALLMKHCVASYQRYIEKDKCLILRYEEHGVFYTAEIIMNRKKDYVVRQLMAKYNEPATQQTVDYVTYILNK